MCPTFNIKTFSVLAFYSSSLGYATVALRSKLMGPNRITGKSTVLLLVDCAREQSSV